MRNMNDTKNVLLIANVSLRNYRAFAGEINFELSLDPVKTITIIHGEMGLGKTTILDSIYWCLYGKERSKRGFDVDTEEGIINTNVLENLNINKKEETFVEITLHDQDGIRLKIKRGIEFAKQVDSFENKPHEALGGKIPNGLDYTPYSEFKYLPPNNDSTNWVVYSRKEQIQKEIEKIFPEALSSYFLFDAELLNDFFNTETDERVKNGIGKISGLTILDNAKENLQKTSKKIQRMIANKDVKIKPIANDKEKLEDKIEYYKRKLEQANIELTQMQSDRIRIQGYLRQHDDQEINSLQKQEDDLNDRINEIEKEKKKNDKEIIKFLRKESYKLMLRDPILTTEEKFQEWENEGRIPLPITKKALKNILNGNPPTCICGTEIKNKSQERENINSLMDRVVDSSLIQQITVGRSILSNVSQSTDPKNLVKILVELQIKRGKFRKIITEKKSEKDVIKKKLDNHNNKDVQENVKQLRKLEHGLSELYGDIKLFKDQIKEGEYIHKDLEKMLYKLTSATIKYKSENDKLKIAKTLSCILEECRDGLVEQFQVTTAEKTTEYFKKMVSKKEDFSKIDILPNYRTIAYDNNQKRKSLSAGQSCCLALSYIAAIREIANRNYFMMIDSPLHNISQEERVEIAQNLPTFLPGTQLTLLVQDQEYTGSPKKKITGKNIPSVRDILQENNIIWKEYLLESIKHAKDKNTNTQIKEIGNKEST